MRQISYSTVAQVMACCLTAPSHHLNQCWFSINGFLWHLFQCNVYLPLLWRHNGRGSVSNQQLHDCLLNRLFRRRSKKTSKLRVTGLCAGIHRGPVNSPHKWPVTRNLFPFDDVIMNAHDVILYVGFQATSPREQWINGVARDWWSAFHRALVRMFFWYFPSYKLIITFFFHIPKINAR